MPEIPEVKNMWRNINNLNIKTINSITAVSGRYTKNNIKDIQLLKFPLNTNKVCTKGKFLWIETNNNENNEIIYICFTFGLTGHLNHTTDMKSIDNILYVRVIIEYIDINNKINFLYFSDKLGYGTINISKDISKKLYNLGYDIIEDDVKDNDVIRIFRNKNNYNICVLLMDQSVLSGIGNYLKSEILYETKISPDVYIRDLSDEQLIDLYRVSKSLATLHYNLSEYYIDDNTNSLKVYKRKVDPYGNIINTKKTLDGRKTYFIEHITSNNIKLKTIKPFVLKLK